MTSRKNKFLGHHGFTMIEIMVALALVAIIFFLIPSNSEQRERRALEAAANEIDRAVRYASDEAILRNVVTRIRINFETEPQEYVVEYGPSGNLPLPEILDTKRLGFREREEQEKKLKSFDQQFIKTDDFSDKPKYFSELITVTGLATSYNPELSTEEHASIYFFPTGEKDSALIILGSFYEMATISIEAFQQETRLDFHPFSASELESSSELQENKAKELFNQWQRGR